MFPSSICVLFFLLLKHPYLAERTKIRGTKKNHRIRHRFQRSFMKTVSQSICGTVSHALNITRKFHLSPLFIAAFNMPIFHNRLGVILTQRPLKAFWQIFTEPFYEGLMKPQVFAFI